MEQPDRIARQSDLNKDLLMKCWHCVEEDTKKKITGKVRDNRVPSPDSGAQNNVRLYECGDCGYYWERRRNQPQSYASPGRRIARQTATDQDDETDRIDICIFVDDKSGAYGDTGNCRTCGHPAIRAFHKRATKLLEAARRCAQRGCTGKPREPHEGEHQALIRCNKCGAPWQRSNKKRR